MSIKQISVFLENRPGTLQKMTSVLAAHKVDIRALSLAETKDFGIARMIVNDVYEAVQILKEGSFIANLTSVLAVAVPDEPGGLDKLLQIFAEESVNIEYMYAFLGKGYPNHAYLIFRVSDTKAAEIRLAGKGLKIMTQEEIAAI